MPKPKDFALKCVTFGSWYASPGNLKQIRDFGRLLLARLKSNRKVTLAGCQAHTLGEVAISAAGTILDLGGYGPVRVFRLDVPGSGAEC